MPKITLELRKSRRFCWCIL